MFSFKETFYNSKIKYLLFEEMFCMLKYFLVFILKNLKKNLYICKLIYFEFIVFKNKCYVILQNVEFWLILPVVICLSQRLSHACLSTHSCKVKPQKAQYISYGSLDRVHSYMDNCGNSRANTCYKSRTARNVCFY